MDVLRGLTLLDDRIEQELMTGRLRLDSTLHELNSNRECNRLLTVSLCEDVWHSGNKL